MQCKCVGDSSVKKLTGLGCVGGGLPYCPDTKVVQSGKICRDGTALYFNDVVRYRTLGKLGYTEGQSCICKDGFAPKCRVGGEVEKCPDGTDFDPSFEPWGGYLNRCERWSN